MYAILDIESTGGKYNEEGITEIAIFKFDGEKIVDQFSALINPERKIQPFVVKLTGINNDMLRHAPKFYEVAKRIIEITEDCIIVAHNSKFDYRLLRTEFRRLGYDYKRKSLCSIELSKKLIPDMPSYSLGKLTKSLGIPLTNRHRAIGDARATVKLFKLLLSKDTKKEIVRNHIRQKPKKRNLGKNLISIIDELPSKTGVYYIHNEKDDIIYIGKSKSIKSRVNQHFTNDSPKARKIQKEVDSVSFDLTGNELIALLLESEEIKHFKPKYNRALKKDTFTHALYAAKDADDYINLKIGKIKSGSKNIITFTSKNQAKHTVEKLVEDYRLCLKKCHLQNTSNACFNYQIKKCKGACLEEEEPETYNKRVQELIEYYSFSDKNLMLIGVGRAPAEKSAVLIEDGSFKGIAYFDLNHQINSPEIIKKLLTPMEDNRDARTIIQGFMRKNNQFNIVPF